MSTEIWGKAQSLPPPPNDLSSSKLHHFEYGTLSWKVVIKIVDLGEGIMIWRQITKSGK